MFPHTQTCVSFQHKLNNVQPHPGPCRLLLYSFNLLSITLKTFITSPHFAHTPRLFNLPLYIQTCSTSPYIPNLCSTSPQVYISRLMFNLLLHM